MFNRVNMRVKICGITEVDQALAIAGHGATHLGCICVPQSPRYLVPEALAAIADPEVLPLLREFISDPVQEVSDTCKIAVQKLEWEQSDDGKSEKDKLSMNPYASVDPAPPAAETDVDVLKKNLLDESAPLFDRYRAMFALRNKGDKESVLALAEGKTKICSQMDARNL